MFNVKMMPRSTFIINICRIIMIKENLKKHTNLIVAGVFFSTIAGGAGYAVLKSKPVKETKLNALEEFQRQDADYQKKITSFDRNMYDMPISALSRVTKSEACINGIGGGLPEIFPGLFDEPLFHLDAESIETERSGEYAYAPYVLAYVAVGDILFKKPMDFFDRKIITEEQLSRNFSDLRSIIGTRVYKNSYQTMEHKFGFPQAYINQQAGSTATLTAFNNSCVKNVGKQNLNFRKVDLSGTPVYQLLSAKYNTTLHHGINGLYNYSSSTTDFVSPNFLNWVKSNNRVYLEILRGKALFPKGSVIYIPSTVEMMDETVLVDFKLQPLQLTKDDWIKQLAKEQSISLIDVSYTVEDFPEFTIYKPIKKSTGDRISTMVLIEKDGKVYAGDWKLPSKSSITGDEPDRNNLVLMNETALTASLNLFKSAYQGLQLDIGTENENLDTRYQNAQSGNNQNLNEIFNEFKKFASPALQDQIDNTIGSNTIPVGQ